MITELLIKSDNTDVIVSVVSTMLSQGVPPFKNGVDIHGVPYLKLQWKGSEGSKELPCVLTSSKSISQLIQSWLDNVDYSKCGYCDGDGTNEKGFILSKGVDLELSLDNAWDSTYYDVIVIQPEWIYYGK